MNEFQVATAFAFQKVDENLYEVKDFVLGVLFYNIWGMPTFYVCTGNYFGVYVTFLGKDFHAYSNYKDLYFAGFNFFEDEVKKNHNIVDFKKIREKQLESVGKYYRKREFYLEMVNEEDKNRNQKGKILSLQNDLFQKKKK